MSYACPMRPIRHVLYSTAPQHTHARPRQEAQARNRSKRETTTVIVESRKKKEEEEEKAEEEQRKKGFFLSSLVLLSSSAARDETVKIRDSNQKCGFSPNWTTDCLKNREKRKDWTPLCVCVCDCVGYFSMDVHPKQLD